ncbi:MAG: caspase family protein [Saprospiraceae bacterium]|nr:caspase family protein [Saprospiraceae bacterium]
MRLILTLFLLLLNTALLQAQCISYDCRNGRWIYVYPSGAKYIVDFKDGEIHGIGTCYYTDGSKYQGEWKYRYPHGKGTKTYSDGYKYIGVWAKGKPVDEQGIALEEYVVANKEEDNDGTDIQSGCIAGDCVNGQGTFAYPDGSKYDGQFVNGKLFGLGTWYYANGDRYVGAFRNNFPHGRGTMFTTDGDETRGEWRDGEYVGTAEPEKVNAGCIAGDCSEGVGTFVYADGSATYKGEFEQSRPSGQGSVTFANGDRYSGEFDEGQFHGRGTLYKRDGTVIRGQWHYGQYEIPEEVQAELLAERAVDTGAVQIVEPMIHARPGKVWAVVVGVAAYHHMPALRYTDDDAYRVYAFFKSPEGGALPDDQIRILVDEEASLVHIRETIQDLFSQAGPDDLVLLYFSGHGVKGAFLPFDFDGYNQKLQHEEIGALLQDSPARYRICFADACHSGGLFAERSPSVQPELVNFYQDLFEAAQGTAIIMSSKSEETSLESSGLRQGVFSHFLIRGLKGEADYSGDKLVSIQELYDYIYVNVRAYTGMRQSPVIKGNYDPQMPVSAIE